MSESTPPRGSAPTRHLRPWRARLVVRRGRVQWQLLTVVTAIAVLACTLISSLALLVAATELGAARGALSSMSADDAAVRTLVTRPSITVTEVREKVERAVDELFADSAATTSETLAISEMYTLQRQGPVDPMFYLGELDNLGDHTELLDGEWPTAATDVAIPDVGAERLGVEVGQTIEFGAREDRAALTVTVSGIYTITDGTGDFWRPDTLSGAGLDTAYPVPGSGGFLVTDAIGPLITAPGTMDAQGVAVENVAIRTVPSFDGTSVEALSPLNERLAQASEVLPGRIGDIADGVQVTTRAGASVSSILTAMAVTRNTVVVVSLLLFVLSVAALGQAARLLTEARVSERHLMRARGSSGRQLLATAAVEAALITALTVMMSPWLARGAYLLIARQPSMLAAGMAVDPGIPPLVWVVALVIGLLFWVVLIAPLLGREGSFQEGEQGKARERRFSGLQRSGVDIALLVLAGVAYWQLQTYQGPSSGSAIGTDPVLVAGPALVMLAGALLAVRLIPVAAALTERLAARAQGAVVALAAWEIARRTQRATAAILLITLALAVGTFSHGFLATWKQSQVDQSEFSLGAPLRLTSDGTPVPLPGDAQPVIRTAGLLAGPDASLAFTDASDGESVAILGVTEASRVLLREGRLGEEGGTVIADSLSEASLPTAFVELPDDTAGLAATVRVTTAEPVPGGQVRLRILVQNASGHESIIDMGIVPMNGNEHQVRGFLPEGVAQNDLLMLAFQVSTTVRDPTLQGATPETKAELLIRDLASVGTPDSSTPDGAYTARPVTVYGQGWRATGEGTGTINYPSAFSPDDWQLGLTYTVPAVLGSRSITHVEMGWAVVTDIPAVITPKLGEAMRAEVGDRLTIILSGVAVGIEIVAIAPAVPGGGSDSVVAPRGGASVDAASTVVVDQTRLSRALFQAGATDTEVREWWLDLPADEVNSFLPYLAVQYDALSAQSSALLSLERQQDPLRVATQGALLLVIGGSAALAAVGFAVHSTGSLRSRSTEFAQLRAVGLSRRRLIGVIGIESLLLCALGIFFGIGLGLLLAYLVGPLVGVSADGSPPVPSVEVHIPYADIALLAAELGLVLAAVVLIAARVQRVAEPASALRAGETR